MRAGLVGTGDWARIVHLAGMRECGDVTPTAVWGRDPAKVAALADEGGLVGCTELEDFLEQVDVLSFAVPPHVQAPIAVRAAKAGKHLLLEKPIAVDVATARELEAAVHEAGVASAVFVTACYTDERRQWVEQVRAAGPRLGATGRFLASALVGDNMFNTPWRHEKGALWDIGPHILAGLDEAVGPVVKVASAVRGEADLVHVVLRHEGGATSSVTATLSADPAIGGADLMVWTATQRFELPKTTTHPATAYAIAMGELVACAATGTAHQYDVSYGRRAVELLAEAERLIG